MFENYKNLPNELIVSLTNACNLKCSYCFQHKKEAIYMTKEIARKSIEFMLSKDDGKIRTINIYGGEPTLNLDAMEELIDTYIELKNKGNTSILYFYINTNGYLVNDRFINIVKKILSVTSFKYVLSLNGDEKSHDSSRGKGTFKKIIENVELLKKEIPNLFVDAHAVLDKTFIADCYKNVKFLLDNKLFTQASSEMFFFGTSEEYSKEDFEIICDTYNKLLPNYNNRNLRFFFSEILSIGNYKNIGKRFPSFCEPGRYILCVDPKGYFLPCDFYLNLKNYDKFIMGNLFGEYEKYNKRSEEYGKITSNILLNKTKCLTENGTNCKNDCDCGSMCDLCYAVIETISNNLIVPQKMCERTKLMAQVFKEKKFIK